MLYRKKEVDETFPKKIISKKGVHSILVPLIEIFNNQSQN
jgi:hypothetical protein